MHIGAFERHNTQCVHFPIWHGDVLLYFFLLLLKPKAMITILDSDPLLHEAEVSLTIGMVVTLLLFICWIFRRPIRKLIRRRRNRRRMKAVDRYSYSYQDNLYQFHENAYYERSRPRILFERVAFNRELPIEEWESSGIDYNELYEFFRLKELAWVITDVYGNELSRHSYTIPLEYGEGRARMLERSLGMFQKELFDCSLVVGLVAEEETFIIEEEIKRIGRKSILQYKNEFSYWNMPDSNVLDFPKEYHKIMHSSLPEAGLIGEAVGLKECFFEQRKRGHLELRENDR